MKMKFFTILIFLFSVSGLIAQDLVKDTYWIKLKDKSGTPCQIEHPEEYLSQRAIDRRTRQHISIDSTDLPVSPVYLDSLKKMGFDLVHSSKWLNGVTARTNDTILVQEAEKLSFVTSMQLTKHGVHQKSALNKFNESDDPSANYGNSWAQLIQLNGQYLHNKGFRGKGVQIAVIDVGFYRVDKINAFDSIRASGRILGTRDFVDPLANVYDQHTHGMSVLSCIAGNILGTMLGTAPDASFYLIRTEDASSESLIEEDNWVAGAEYADSVGVDVINSSLGYMQFDDSLMNHVYADMDGKTTRITQGANMAFQKGILVFTSAGNEGNSFWRRIVAPSDGTGVIGVAAVNSNGIRAGFSSIGPAASGAVKPNVAATGWGTFLITSSQTPGTSNGTSFASPVLAGMGACLLQANPDADVKLIKQAIEQSASQYATPDSLIGYGIPDFEKADKFLKTNAVSQIAQNKSWRVYPNPFSNMVTIKSTTSLSGEKSRARIFNVQGICVKEAEIAPSGNLELNNLATFPDGLYFLKIDSGTTQETIKLVKK